MIRIVQKIVLILFIVLLVSSTVNAESSNPFSSFIESIKNFFVPSDEEQSLNVQTPSFLSPKEDKIESLQKVEDNKIEVPEQLTPYVITYEDDVGNTVTQTLYYDSNNELFWIETVSSSKRELVDKNGNIVDQEIFNLALENKVDAERLQDIKLLRDSSLTSATGNSVASTSAQGASVVLATIIILASFLGYGFIIKKDQF